LIERERPTDREENGDGRKKLREKLLDSYEERREIREKYEPPAVDSREKGGLDRGEKLNERRMSFDYNFGGLGLGGDTFFLKE